METNLEWILTNSIKADMIAFIAANPVYFEELILKMMSGEEYLESLSSTVRKAIRRMIN
jgi:hypothetical protein